METPMPQRGLKYGLGVLAVLMLGAWTSLPVQLGASMATLQIAKIDTPLFLGSIDDWEIWELQSGDDRICYVMTETKSSVIDSVHDSIPVVQVTRVPGEPVVTQVSVILGYRHSGDKAVRVEVDGRPFEPFTQHNPHPTDENEGGDEDTNEKISRAWIAEAESEEALFKAMRAGNIMSVRGKTDAGMAIEDRFSLIGLTRAHRIMSDRCSERWPDLRAIKPDRRRRR
jgi:hypothetical protein